MEALYELWLHSICKYEPQTAEKIAQAFNSHSKGFSSPQKDIRKLTEMGIKKEFIQRLSDPKYFEEASIQLEYCEKNGIRIITQESSEYPESLKTISSPPRILFAKGERIDLNNNCFVSVVGCRKSDEQGRSIARQIGRSLAENGIITVSGMAEGIDAASHWGAVEAGGKTIAVLAGSVDVIYPKSNERLYHKILENGTVLSERPPGTDVRKYFYKQRNRIVVGLSRGTVVVQGKAAGGTAISANLALENGRDIFAVPGNPLAWQSELPNRLIVDGATVVDKVDVPAKYYGKQLPHIPKRAEINKATPHLDLWENLSERDRQILTYVVDNGGVATTEALAEATGLPAGVLGSALTLLEIRGYIRQESGGKIVLDRVPIGI